MIGYGIGYPIGTLISGANRVGTNPPTRPDPIPVVTSVCGCRTQLRIRKERKQGRIGFGVNQ